VRAQQSRHRVPAPIRGIKNRLSKPGSLSHFVEVKNPGAYVLRETTGTSGLEQTARSVAAALAQFNIPHLLVGGLAVQEHGYHRVTLDVDLVVPDILEAVEFLTADLSGPFARVSVCEDRVQDRRNGVFVDLLPAGRVLRRGCGVPFP
jgi:hypothetical protein